MDFQVGSIEILDLWPDTFAVTLKTCFKVQAFTGGHDGEAVTANIATYQNGVPLTDISWQDRARCHQLSQTGDIDVQSITSAPFDYLGIATHNLNSSSACLLTHRHHDFLQNSDLQALLQDESHRQGQRTSAADRQIIEGAADGQGSNVAPWEKKRLDYIGVGGNHRISLDSSQAGTIVLTCLLAEMFENHMLQQVTAMTGSATVGEQDPFLGRVGERTTQVH